MSFLPSPQVLLGLERKWWVLFPGIPTYSGWLQSSVFRLLSLQSSSSLCLWEGAEQCLR